MKRFLLYLLRWQLSTPVLAIFVYIITNEILATFIANLVGGFIFYWVDRFIFTSKFLNPLWEIRSNETCFDCGAEGYGFRVALNTGYDKTRDTSPQFRCYKCAVKKARDMGIDI